MADRRKVKSGDDRAAGNGTARIFVDADGDGAIDMRINVRNTTDLLETDFIL